MKTAVFNRYGEPGVVEFTEIDTPKPGPDEVLIRVHTMAVNPVDWKIVKGKIKLITGWKFPKFIGIEGSGVIEEVGSNVSGFKKEQRVFVGLDYNGGICAEYVCAPATKIMAISDELTHEESCTMAIAGLSALQGLRDKGNLKAGMEVLINGASGGVGTYAIQIAKLLGANVTAVCSGKNFELVKSIGADNVIDYQKEAFTANKKKYDIVFDAVGNYSFWQVKHILKNKGVNVNISPSPGLYLSSLLTGFFSGKKSISYMLKPVMTDLKEIMDMITSRKISVVIDKKFPFEETAKALEYSKSERARGKIIILIR